MGDLVSIDGDLWRCVSLDPLVMRRCRDGRIGIGNKHGRENG